MRRITTTKKPVPDIEHNLSNSLGVNLSNVLCDTQSNLEPTMQCDVASMQSMMEEPREMLNNTIQQNTELCMQNTELMEDNQQYSRERIRPEATKMKIFDMTHPELYSGRAPALNNLLNTLWSNFQSNVHLLPHGDPEKVKYTASLLSTWNNHPYLAVIQTELMDPVDWLRDLQRDSDHSLDDFKSISKEMEMGYWDKDRKLNVAMKCMTNLPQGENKPVRVYTNRIKLKGRALVRRPQDNGNLDEIG